MQLPKAIKVGPFTYQVREWNGGGDHGACDSDELVISVDSTKPTEQIKNTLLHEILHAVWYVWGLNKPNEEAAVNALANGLQTVFRDNPKLIEWMK